MSINPNTIKPGTVIYSPDMGMGIYTGKRRISYTGVEEDILDFHYPSQRNFTKSVPVSKIGPDSVYHLCSYQEAIEALRNLGKPPKSRKGSWARRKTELEAKLNSPDLKDVAGVVHLLLSEHRNRGYKTHDSLTDLPLIMVPVSELVSGHG